MEDINNDDSNDKSYRYDNYCNIIVENVDDLLYDKFDYDEKDIKIYNNKKNKQHTTSYIFKNKQNSHSQKNNSKNSYSNKNIIKKKIKPVLFTLDKIYISKDEDNIRYKQFINKNKKFIMYLKNNKLNKKANSIKNKNIENKNKKLCHVDINIFNKIQKNNKDINENKCEDNKDDNKDNNKDDNKDNVINSNYNENSYYRNILNSEKQNNRYNCRRINNLNLYKYYSQKNTNKISNKISLNKNYYMNYMNRNYHSMKDSLLLNKEKNKLNKYINLNDLFNEKMMYKTYLKKKFKKKKINNDNKKEEENPSKDLDFNLISFSYPKKEDNIKQYHNENHNYKKHFGGEKDCPLCQSISIKTKNNEQLMGVYKNDKQNITKKNNIRKILFKNNSNSNISQKNNKNDSSSKIIYYKKDLGFFNATKGISNSNSAIDLCNSNNNKISYIYKKNNKDFPVMIYYFK